MSAPYQLAATTFGPEEIDAAKAVLDSGRFTMGEKVAKFETEFAAWVGSKHALMVNSGSSSNLLMVDALLRRSNAATPWKKGDEVLVPALAWPTTVWPLVQLGLVPVYVDVDPNTLAIDLTSAKAALSPRTKGMFLIHVLGLAADLGAISRFCADHGITLLEDNCESLGAHYEGRAAGTWGAMGSFSCYFSHHISTMEGGMIVTDDSALFDDLRSLRAHGWVRDRSDKAEWVKKHPELDPRFMFIMPGYNVRPTEVQAAIGSVQLAKLDRMIEGREKLAREVRDLTQKHAPWMKLIGADHIGKEGAPNRRARRHSWMNFPFVLDKNAPVRVDAVKAALEKEGVDTRPIIAGNLARHPANSMCETRSAPSLAQCDEVLSRGFMIGCHPILDDATHATLRRGFEALSKF